MITLNTPYNYQNTKNYNNSNQNISFEGKKVPLLKKVCAPIIKPIEFGMTKYADWVASKNIVQIINKKMPENFVQNWVPTLISMWISSFYILFTLNDKNIEEERKKTLCINMGFVALFCAAVTALTRKGIGTSLSKKMIDSFTDKRIPENKALKEKIRALKLIDFSSVKSDEVTKLDELIKKIGEDSSLTGALEELRIPFKGEKIEPQIEEILRFAKDKENKKLSSSQLSEEVLKPYFKINDKDKELSIYDMVNNLQKEIDFGNVLSKLDHNGYSEIETLLAKSKAGTISEEETKNLNKLKDSLDDIYSPLKKLSNGTALNAEETEKLKSAKLKEERKDRIKEFLGLKTDDDVKIFVEVADFISGVGYTIPLIANTLVFRMVGPILATPFAAWVTNLHEDRKKAKQAMNDAITHPINAKPLQKDGTTFSKTV